jgi:hypothetical protein
MTWTVPPLGEGDLGREVCRPSEAVKPETAPGGELGTGKRAIANYPGTQQRGNGLVVEARRQPVDEPLVGHHVLGKAAVNVPASKTWRQA